MTNREKYREELMEACRDNDVESFFDEHIKDTYSCNTWKFMDSDATAILTTLWLDEEYREPEVSVDWSKVEVDTPILVRDGDDEDWNRAHFSDYECGKVYAWDEGGTSWTSDNEKYWMQAKLAEPQE